MVADLREQIIENCKFLLHGCNPVVLTRSWSGTNPRGGVYTELQAFVVERFNSCFLPIDTGLDATGLIVDVRHTYYGSAPESHHYPFIMNKLLVKTQNLIHQKIEKQSAEAAGVEAEVEQFFSRLAAVVQDEEVKEKLRKRLLRRAFNKLVCKERKHRDDVENQVDELMEILTLNEESVKEKDLKSREEEEAIEHAEEVRAILAREEQQRVDEIAVEEEESIEDRFDEYLMYRADLEDARESGYEEDLVIEQAIEVDALLKEEKLREEMKLRSTEPPVDPWVESILLAREEQLRVVDKMAAEEEKRLEIQVAVHAAETFAEEKYNALQKEYTELEMDYVALRDEFNCIESEAHYRESEFNNIRDKLEQQLIDANEEKTKAQEKARVDVEREKGFRKALEGAIDVFRQTEAEGIEEIESVRKDLDLARAQYAAGIERQIRLEDELRKVQDEYARRARRTKEGANKVFYTSRTKDIKKLLLPPPEVRGSSENTGVSPIEFTPPSSPNGRPLA
ncbi:hypothetical protein BDD12DRAFT_253473 [Trichophaea hybrida]|nr:hypothetical protein BDD12DRAFT_253473 [Trichophaea hybrida]